jgi:hypothetical protein
VLAFEQMTPQRFSFSDDHLIPASSSGSYSVTGVGFQPEFLVIIGIGTATEEQSGTSHTFDGIKGLHVGMSDGTSEWCGCVSAADLSSVRSKLFSATNIMYVMDETTATVIQANLSSFDADGFTLNISSAPSNDVLIQFYAMRGGGSYVVGTALGPAANGTQAISGLGIQPTSLLFASTQVEALDTPETDWFCMFGGASDPSYFGLADPTVQYAAWGGATQATPVDNYSDKLISPDSCILMAIDSDLAAPAPVILAEANLDSFDADGFTLDWTTTDGTQRYYGWFACDGASEVKRWVYNWSAAPGQGGAVATHKRPRGLLFFNNDLGVDSMDHETEHPANIGFGVMGVNGGQGHVACAEWCQPPLDVQQTGSVIYLGEGFGCHKGAVGGVTGNIGNSGNDAGVVRLVGRDHLLRLHMSQ